MSIFSVIGLKTAIDLAFYLWSIHLYRRWTGHAHRHQFVDGGAGGDRRAVHVPAACDTSALLLGWLHFLRGGRSWGVQRRSGLVTRDES